MAEANKVLMISGRWHDTLKYLATLRGARAGRSISMKELAEIAFEQAYGSLDQLDAEREKLKLPGDVAAERESWTQPDNADVLFGKMVTAALVHRKTNRFIDEWFRPEMRVAPEVHDRMYRVRDLAYYLRSTKLQIRSLEDLCIAYELGR